VNRREALAGAAAIGASTACLLATGRKRATDVRPKLSRVLIASVDNYGSGLPDALFRATREFRLHVEGKRVLLKPNLVEYAPGAAVNTDARVIAAAVEAFLRLGAESVVVAEGPGHQRDTELILEATGLGIALNCRRVRFVDLNRDAVRAIPTRSRYTRLDALWLPETVLATDLVVSMPKVKTHHWAGVTLSLKNMFGVLPGSQYGWPKNVLHWAGIPESILDVCSTVRPGFVIADGIEAMEGNGPLHGASRALHKLVFADDPVAADATCARLMGLRPLVIRHLAEAATFLGNADPERIHMLGEPARTIGPAFDVVPELRFLQWRAEDEPPA
jgi:uncharacterized protein (DUF362 family)